MLTRILAPILCTLLAVASACDQQSDAAVVAPALNAASSWYEIVRQDPDPAVVTDAAARARMTATKLPWKVRDRKTGIVMLLCPPGEFMMGSPASEAGRMDNEAQHSVTITKAFYLSETEVTQESWQKVMGANPSGFNGASNPVEQVSWNDCQSFCQSSGLRLASESEWEYACRAGTTGPYAGDLASMAWFGDNSGRSALDADALWKRDSSSYGQQLIDNGCQTHPVKQRKPNAWGLYDMHGNVWEWCEDVYAQSASSTQQASTGNDGARVLRGGGWSTLASGCRSALRFTYAPGTTLVIFGFRVARTSDDQQSDPVVVARAPAPTPPKPADSKLALDWCDVVAADPDPALVTGAAARGRMTATKLPWKVRDRKTGIVMLLCPPGEFMMGSPASEAGSSDNEAQHRVQITKAFYLSETEVTQEVWQKVMGTNPSQFNGASNPVEQVSPYDCQSFCQASGLRLPSESEWEYACRAGTTGAYAGDLASMAWFGDNSGRSALDADALWKRDSSRYGQQLIENGCQTHPVKQRKPNAWGLYDMHGNVWEWCEDGYAQSASSTQQASTGNVGSRVLRGGGWGFGASDCRSAYRVSRPAGYSSNGFGFRVARAPL